MEKMTYVQSLYPEEYQLWLEDNDIFCLYDYKPIINSLGDVVFTLSDNDYCGDTFVLYHTGNIWEYLEFGWGSCSGCDALQGCETWEEVVNLIKELKNSKIKFENITAALDYFTNHDWNGDWTTETKKTFINCAIKILTEIKKQEN